MTIFKVYHRCIEDYTGVILFNEEKYYDSIENAEKALQSINSTPRDESFTLPGDIYSGVEEIEIEI